MVAAPQEGLERGDRPAPTLRERRAVAAGFQRALEEARQPRRGLTAAVPVRGEAVLIAAEALEALAARLRDVSRTVDATAFDAATDLLCDGSGPLYQWAEPATLRRRARVICEDL